MGWPGFTEFCTNGGDSSLRPIDCAMVVLFGSLFNETASALKICNPTHALGLPTPDDVLKKTFALVDGELANCDARRSELINAAKELLIPLPFVPSCPPSPVAEWHKKLDGEVLKVDKEVENFALSLATQGVGTAIAYDNALTLVKANALGAVAANDDQGRHLAVQLH